MHNTTSVNKFETRKLSLMPLSQLDVMVNQRIYSYNICSILRFAGYVLLLLHIDTRKSLHVLFWVSEIIRLNQVQGKDCMIKYKAK